MLYQRATHHFIRFSYMTEGLSRYKTARIASSRSLKVTYEQSVRTDSVGSRTEQTARAPGLEREQCRRTPPLRELCWWTPPLRELCWWTPPLWELCGQTPPLRELCGARGNIRGLHRFEEGPKRALPPRRRHQRATPL